MERGGRGARRATASAAQQRRGGYGSGGRGGPRRTRLSRLDEMADAQAAEQSSEQRAVSSVSSERGRWADGARWPIIVLCTVGGVRDRASGLFKVLGLEVWSQEVWSVQWSLECSFFYLCLLS